MIRIATRNDLESINLFIGDDYQECLYLYLNLKRYGLDNPDICVWIDENTDGIQYIFLRYFDCLHIFGKSLLKLTPENVRFIKEIDPQTVFVPIKVGTQVDEVLCKAGYVSEKMDVVHSDTLLSRKASNTEHVKREEIFELAEFMMTDRAYSEIYNIQGLYEQLLKRFDDNYSRFHVLRQNGKIVATYSTNAETENIAVMGGLLTSSSERKKGYGSTMIASIWNEVISENKKGYAFIVSPKSLSIHLKLGCSIVGTIIKLHKKPY